MTFSVSLCLWASSSDFLDFSHSNNLCLSISFLACSLCSSSLLACSSLSLGSSLSLAFLASNSANLLASASLFCFSLCSCSSFSFLALSSFSFFCCSNRLALLLLSSCAPASQFSLLLSSKLAGLPASSCPPLFTLLPGVDTVWLWGWFFLILGGTRFKGRTEGKGSPFCPTSHRCMARINSSTLSFPSLSMSAKFHTVARVCCDSPVCRRMFLA